MQAIGWALFAMAAAAAAGGDARPSPLTALSDCRGIADNMARLACYDRAAASLQKAVTDRDIVVMDREKVRQTRRTLFGFSLPRLGLFGGDDDSDEEVERISSRVQQARSGADGRWLITLEDGARWRQIDDRQILSPRNGQPIEIRKAALGSYFANINRQTAIRVRREN